MAIAYDAVIVGAGLSGLSLAAHLAGGPWSGRRVLVVDDGADDIRHRGWAFWSRDPGWLAPAVSASWDAVSVRASSFASVLPLFPYRYHAIGGAALLDLVTDRMRAAGFEVVVGRVDGVRDGAGGAVVTVDGSDVPSSWVFDSRPPVPPATGPSLRFHGRHVAVERDAFDPSTVTFMDFRATRPGRVAFGYVLPYSARSALVEIADMGWTPPPSLVDDLSGYLQRCWGVSASTTLSEESQSLPLAAPTTPRAGLRTLSIGRRGGLLKPSTGYALDRIQRDSAAICRSLAVHGHPFDLPPPSRRRAWLDRVLLDVIRTDPGGIERTFARLFARNRMPSILSFLDEDATPGQEARIVATLPPTPFIRSALRLGR